MFDQEIPWGKAVAITGIVLFLATAIVLSFGPEEPTLIQNDQEVLTVEQ